MDGNQSGNPAVAVARPASTPPAAGYPAEGLDNQMRCKCHRCYDTMRSLVGTKLPW